MSFEPYLTPQQWCERRCMSMSSYYRLKKIGAAPEVLYYGRKPVITPEADRKWESEMIERSRAAQKSARETALKYSRLPEVTDHV